MGRRRDWLLALLGMVVAILGGVAEYHHDLILGGVSVVLGLSDWVVFSGSAMVDAGIHHKEPPAGPRNSWLHRSYDDHPHADLPNSEFPS